MISVLVVGAQPLRRFGFWVLAKVGARDRIQAVVLAYDLRLTRPVQQSVGSFDLGELNCEGSETVMMPVHISSLVPSAHTT